MSKKVVLVTGGSSGIGRAIGNFLKDKGYTVYGTTRNLQKNQGFTDFELLELDVRKTDTVHTALQMLLKKEGKLDILINNAGIGITGPIEETPNDAIQNAFETNFIGPLNMIKVVLPIMRSQQQGRIINITSIAGKMGLPYRGIYSASKGALDLATEAIRLETGKFGIYISTLAPGDFATNIAAGRFHAPVLQESPYKEPYGRTLQMINDDVDKAGDPVEVAKKVYCILQSKAPKVHYKVGSFMQKFSIVLKKLLPSKVYEKLLRNHYKL
jgi:NAD(P)-dependent dehydrogenase (short-subunit alcohol dehydrogenase family)